MADELSTVEKLKDSVNYTMWKFQVAIFLKAKQMYEIVTGTTPQPASTADKKDIDEWNRKDAIAQKIIITIDRQPLTHLLNCKTSHDMYDKLRKVYEKDTQQQKYGLLQEFYSFQYNKDMNISTYICGLENIKHRLSILSEVITEAMLITKILSGLPIKTCYKHFLSACDSTSTNDQTIENLTSRLMTEEMRQQSETQEKQVAFASSYNNKRPGKTPRETNNNNTCYRCGETGHFKRDCKKQSKPQESRRCSICKKTNHVEADCFFRNRRNNNDSSSGSGNNRRVAFLTEDTKEQDNTSNETWILDSGATTHMVNDKKMHLE